MDEIMQQEFDFYNTAHEVADTHLKSKTTAQRQQLVIYAFFQTHEGGYSPCDLIHFHDWPFLSWPITSIRRAITNLSKEGKLKKTHNMKIGIYGKQVHTWRLA